MAGGDDYEVAGLANFPYTPTVIVPQGGGDKSTMEIVSTTIGNTEVRGNPLLMSSLCIGDKVSNVRALLKRYCKFEKQGVNSVSTMNLYGIRIVPDMILSTGAPGAIPAQYFAADFISIWASCYLMMSGGIRIKDVIDNGLITTGTYSQTLHTPVTAILQSDTLVAEATILYDTGQAPQSANYHRVVQDVSVNNTLNVEMPQYTRSFTRLVPDVICYQDTSMSTANNYTADSSGSTTRLYIYLPASTTVTPVADYTLHRVYRAAADDFNLSGFISVPPMIVTNPAGHAGFY